LPEIKLSLEILQSQVDALQSLANTQNISLSEDVYLSEITRLNEELSVEKEKRQEIERKLQSLTDKLFHLENCNLNTKLANNTTNNENLASSELTNFMARIVIPDDTSEGSHTIAENANDINIRSGNIDHSADSSQMSHNTLLFEDELPNRNKTSITNANPTTGESPNSTITAINTQPPLLARLPPINTDVITKNNPRQLIVSTSNHKSEVSDGGHTISSGQSRNKGTNRVGDNSRGSSRSRSKFQDQDPFRKNPFPKNHFRCRPLSYLKRPTQEWLNHLELVYQMMNPTNHSRDGQFLFQLQPDPSRNTSFHPLIGQVWFSIVKILLK
jgi:hypothetical protein